MATAPESRWRTALYALGAILGIILTITGIMTNVFGMLDRGNRTAEAEASKTVIGPDTAKAPVDADTTTDALRNAERHTAAWVAALNAQDIDKLVILSEPPFFLDQDNILLSKPEIRQSYSELVGMRTADADATPIKVDQLKAETIGGLRAKGWNDASDRFMNRLNLNDNDIAVSIMSGGEGAILFFRRSGSKVEFAGMWD